MEPDYEYLDVFSRRYIRVANKLRVAGEAERADAFRAMGSAMQLFPGTGARDAARGQFFGPMMSGSFGEVPSMAFMRRAETISFLRTRLPRVKHRLRRARLADTIWEFAERPDAEAARIAADAYLDVGSRQVVDMAEHAPMSGAGAFARSLRLARAINDAARVQRVVASINDALRSLAVRGGEDAALFTLVEALLSGQKGAADLDPADEALRQRYEALSSSQDDNFHFVQVAIAKGRRPSW